MLSILIPDHNEANVRDFVDEVERLGIANEIIISKDSQSKGKGWALREAFKESKGDFIAFIDGDNDIKPRMFYRLIPFLQDFDVVVGSKRLAYKAPLRRKIMTHVTRWWFKLLFGLRCDSQTGIKLFSRVALSSIEDWEANRWLFDAEILVKLQRKGFKIIEVPIEAEIKRQLPVSRIFKIFLESLWLKSRL